MVRAAVSLLPAASCNWESYTCLFVHAEGRDAGAGAPGSDFTNVVDEAFEAGAALLVVGSRSRSRLAGMLLGSTALHCVVAAPCPVLVLHPQPVPADVPTV